MVESRIKSLVFTLVLIIILDLAASSSTKNTITNITKITKTTNVTKTTKITNTTKKITKITLVKPVGRTLSKSAWFNKNPNEIPGAQQGRFLEESSNNTKYTVKMITTNTRLGPVDVTTLENRTYGIFVGKDPPDNIYHGAIAVHGYVFEFIFDKGIDATAEKSYIEDNPPIYFDSEFETSMTDKDVKDWLAKKTVVYNQGTYHVVYHNCFNFAKAFCEFLGGTEPEKNTKQREWLQENEEIGAVINELLKLSYELNAPDETDDTTESSEGVF